MQAFSLIEPHDAQSAIAAASTPGAKYIAGGTDLLQLAKDNVETPQRLIDLQSLPAAGIHANAARLHLEPLARMSDVAGHHDVVTRWPVLSQALLASASPQIRNMATMGGNLLQRTGAAISVILVSYVTSASPDPVVRRSPARTGCWQFSAPATTA